MQSSEGQLCEKGGGGRALDSRCLRDSGAEMPSRQGNIQALNSLEVWPGEGRKGNNREYKLPNIWLSGGGRGNSKWMGKELAMRQWNHRIRGRTG